MRVKDAFPSKYLCGDDLGGCATTVTIDKIVKQRMPARTGIPASDVWVMFFEGKKKGLIIRRGLAQQIAAALNDDEMDYWPGRQITLYPETIKIAGETHTTVRARKPSPTTSQSAQ